MPELPDITVYVESLAARLRGDRLERVRVLNPFVLRTAVPPLSEIEGRGVVGVERLGKRVVIELDGERFVVIHLMIAGRLKWLPAGAKPPAKGALATLAFGGGTLVLTEAGTQRRASIHLVAGRDALAAMNPGGIDPLSCDTARFAQQLALENHTLKRSLTNPRLFSGIGNAYSDEILHRARLSPLKLAQQLASSEIARLHVAVHDVLAEWTRRLRLEAGESFPDKVTAFRPEMAVHGRYGQPCPVCAAPVQRIVHVDNEINYCARCQTDGRVLADRALSQLLHDSFPRRIEDLE